MIVIAAFVALGALVGSLIGLSADSVVKTFLPILFAFGGGSLIAIQTKLSKDQFIVSCNAIFLFSVSCLLFVILSLFAAEYQIFTPENLRVTSPESVANIAARRPITSTARAAFFSNFVALDQQLRNGQISQDQFVELIREEYNRLESQND